MGARFRSWWQYIREHWVLVVTILALVIVIVALIIIGYKFDWTGFNGNNKSGKTLWDWLQLLIVPLVLAVGGFWLSQMQKTTEQRRTTDNQHEAALQAYIDKMSELLLKEHLGERTADGKLKPDYEQVRNVARVRTITLLIQLDARRIGYVFAFLREAGLMSLTLEDDVVSLKDADLHEVNWSQADLGGAILRGANLNRANLHRTFLFGANLTDANLMGANLSEAWLSYVVLARADLRAANLSEALLIDEVDLTEANLSGANLSNADLSNANLNGANLKGAIGVTTEKLGKAASLKGATMPDGSIHP